MKRALACLVLAACGGTRFEALTAPPPGATAELDDNDNRIAVSRGVAFAFECLDVRGYSPCGGGTITVADPSVARAYPAYLDALRADDLNGPQSRTAFVVVGAAPGGTTLRVETSAGDRDFDVTITP